MDKIKVKLTRGQVEFLRDIFNMCLAHKPIGILYLPAVVCLEFYESKYKKFALIDPKTTSFSLKLSEAIAISMLISRLKYKDSETAGYAQVLYDTLLNSTPKQQWKFYQMATDLNPQAAPPSPHGNTPPESASFTVAEHGYLR